MFTIEMLRGKVAEVTAGHLTLDDFGDWFISESWGHYDGRGDPTSEAIAAVTHVLHDYGELDEAQVPRELANAICQQDESGDV